MNAFKMFKRCAEHQHPSRPSELFYWGEETIDLWPDANIPHAGPGDYIRSKLLTLKWDADTRPVYAQMPQVSLWHPFVEDRV